MRLCERDELQEDFMDILKAVLNCLSTQPGHSAAHLAMELHRHLS